MASRITFQYSPGDSPLHLWDARSKLCGLVLITATLLPTRIEWFLFDFVLLLGLLRLSRLPLRPFLRDLRGWALLLLVLFLFQAVFTEGNRLTHIPWLPLSREGLRLGGLTLFRLTLLLCYGILFTAVTRSRDLQDGITWFLKPLPFLSGRRIGLMVSLSLRFFFFIYVQSEEVQLAQRARLGDGRRNALRKIKLLVLPVLRRSLLRAEEVSLALAARGYNDALPLQLPPPRLIEWIPLAVFAGFLILITMLV